MCLQNALGVHRWLFILLCPRLIENEFLKPPLKILVCREFFENFRLREKVFLHLYVVKESGRFPVKRNIVNCLFSSNHGNINTEQHCISQWDF